MCDILKFSDSRTFRAWLEKTIQAAMEYGCFWQKKGGPETLSADAALKSSPLFWL